MRLCVDHFGGTKFDGRLIGLILTEFLFFKSIHLWSDSCQPIKKDIEKYYQANLKGRITDPTL